MKLVNGFKLMEYAKRNNFVLPAFNTTNLEMTYAIVDGLMKANLPGYIQILLTICVCPIRQLLQI